MFIEHYSKIKKLVVISSFQNEKSSLVGQMSNWQKLLSNVVKVNIFSEIDEICFERRRFKEAEVPSY